MGIHQVLGQCRLQQGSNRQRAARADQRGRSEGITDKSQYKPFYSMLEQSDGYSPSSFKVKGWSEISDKLALSFEKMYNPPPSKIPLRPSPKR